jgi:alpha-amylase
MNYETFGELQGRESGIFEFMKALPRFAAESKVSFSTPSEVVGKLKSVAEIPVPYPVSWADEERDTTNWLGNQLQNAACAKLYSVSERVRLIEDLRIKQDWMYLQSSDHFYYMSTKHSSDGSMRNIFSPYDSPYDAFTNYMNVLGDFITRVESQYPSSIENDELNSLLSTIKNQGEEIVTLEKEIKKLKASKNKQTASSESPSKKKRSK